MASKAKVKNEVKGHNPHKTHLHPLSMLRDVFIQYENNASSGFRDIVRKRKTRTHGRTGRHADENTPALRGIM